MHALPFQAAQVSAGLADIPSSRSGFIQDQIQDQIRAVSGLPTFTALLFSRLAAHWPRNILP